MKTEPFRQRLHRRNGIEGTQSELVRVHGLRHACYRGYKKLALQNYLIGAARNIKRWLRRVAWEMQPPEVALCNTAQKGGAPQPPGEKSGRM